MREDYLDDINLVIELDSGKRSQVIVLEMLVLVAHEAQDMAMVLFLTGLR